MSAKAALEARELERREAQQRKDGGRSKGTRGDFKLLSFGDEAEEAVVKRSKGAS